MTDLKKRIIIFGASGFIGKRLCEKFSACRNLTVKGFSSQDCDLLSREHARSVLSDLTKDDVVIMAAAITRLKENSYQAMLKNIQMVENMLDAVIKHPVKQVVYLSTVDVYGVKLAKNALISERLPLDPNDYYAVSKSTCEFLCNETCRKLGIPLAILRLSGVYGPDDSGKSLIGAFIGTALKKQNIYIYGKGDNLRDYVYVDDVYRVIDAAIAKKLNKTLNVASGKSYAILEIVKIIQALFKGETRVEFKPTPENAEKRIEDMNFDTTLFREEFPDLRMLDLKAGISLYLANTEKGNY